MYWPERKHFIWKKVTGISRFRLIYGGVSLYSVPTASKTAWASFIYHTHDRTQRRLNVCYAVVILCENSILHESSSLKWLITGLCLNGIRLKKCEKLQIWITHQNRSCHSCLVTVSWRRSFRTVGRIDGHLSSNFIWPCCCKRIHKNPDLIKL